MPLHTKRGRDWGPPTGITDTDNQRRVEEDGFTTMGPWGMRPWPLTFLAGRPITSSGGGVEQLTSWVNANHPTPPLVNRIIALDSTIGHWPLAWPYVTVYLKLHYRGSFGLAINIRGAWIGVTFE